MEEIIKYKSADGIIFVDKKTCLQWESACYFENAIENGLIETLRNDKDNFMNNLDIIITGMKHRIADDSE